MTVPLLTDDGETVLAVIGLGFATEREVTNEEIACLAAGAEPVLDIVG